MFGYVLPRPADLRVKELEYYRALYCGICREEKKLSRRLPALLSYDAVLLALCRVGAAEERSSLARCRCAAHPVRKTRYVKDSPALAYTAAAMALLTYGKLEDDRKDEKGRRLARAIAAGGVKKSIKKVPLPSLAAILHTKLEALAALEEQKEPSVYPGASLFGELLGAIFAFDPVTDRPDASSSENSGSGNPGSGKKKVATSGALAAASGASAATSAAADCFALPPLRPDQALCLKEIGYRVGRVIYLLDAISDYDDDKKSGSYNALVLSGADRWDSGFITDMTAALKWELSCAAGALDLLSLPDPGIEAIIRNILVLGLADMVDSVVARGKRMKFSGKKEAIPQ